MTGCEGELSGAVSAAGFFAFMCIVAWKLL